MKIIQKILGYVFSCVAYIAVWFAAAFFVTMANDIRMLLPELHALRDLDSPTLWLLIADNASWDATVCIWLAIPCCIAQFGLFALVSGIKNTAWVVALAQLAKNGVIAIRTHLHLPGHLNPAWLKLQEIRAKCALTWLSCSIALVIGTGGGILIEPFSESSWAGHDGETIVNIGKFNFWFGVFCNSVAVFFASLLAGFVVGGIIQRHSARTQSNMETSTGPVNSNLERPSLSGNQPAE